MSVPVHLHRFSFFRPLSLSVSCVPCLPSQLPFPHPNPHTSPIFSPASSAKAFAVPHEGTPVSLALNATHMLEKSEGRTPTLPQEDTSASLAILAKHLLTKSEGGAHSPYDDTRASSARKISASHMLMPSEGNNNPPPLSPCLSVFLLVSPLIHHVSCPLHLCPTPNQSQQTNTTRSPTRHTQTTQP